MKDRETILIKLSVNFQEHFYTDPMCWEFCNFVDCARVASVSVIQDISMILRGPDLITSMQDFLLHCFLWGP